MAKALLWLEHVALVGRSFALLLACLPAWPARRRALTVALAAGLPLLAHAALAVLAITLRFDLGVPHAPWVYATSLFLALAVLLAGLARRGLRGAPPAAAGWSRGTLALAAGLALLLEGMTVWNLELAVGQELSALELEAGLMAAAVTPAPPRPEENAAPRIERALREWRAAEGELLPERYDVVPIEPSCWRATSPATAR